MKNDPHFAETSPFPTAVLLLRGNVLLISYGLVSTSGVDRFSTSCDSTRSAAAQSEGESAGETPAGGQIVGEGGLDALPIGLHVFLVQLVDRGNSTRHGTTSNQHIVLKKKNKVRSCQSDK